MRIVIAGTVGPTGQRLVQRLNELGHAPLLLGEDSAALATRFPETTAIGHGYDLLVYWAIEERSGAADIDGDGRPAAYVASLARAANIGRFIYVTSIAALERRSAEKGLRKVDGIDLRIFYLPAIRQPGAGTTPIGSLIRASRPTVHLDTLVDRIVSTHQGPDAACIIADLQDSNPTFRFLKRAIDLVLALGILACLWWAMIIVWAAVRLQSPGPGIYRQPRIGRDGHIFTCLKFRTMVLSTPDKGTHEISDTAVTGLGRFLRRTKLDELPQVFNVIRNEMTFVGPRPSLPSQLAVISEREKRGILRAKPGITGSAQVNGIDMSDPVRLAGSDYRYLQLQSLSLDFQIMLATLVGRGRGDRTRK